MTAPVRILVAGAGLIGRRHIELVGEEPEARLAGIADPSPQAQAIAARLGVPCHATLEEALADLQPDAAIIATPNAMHVPHGLACVAAGVPMLMEKPVADDLAEGMRLVVAAEAAGVPILTGHHHRHSPLINGAKEIVASGRLGRIVAVNGLCWFRKPDDYFQGAGAWRTRPGGGVMLINLVHVIDDLRNICGDVAAVQAVQSSAARGFAVEDTAAMLLHFANGAIGTVSISDIAAAPWSWELTSGENKAYPRTDEACYLIAGTDGSVTVPRLDVWSYPSRKDWWEPFERTRRVAPDQDPLVLQLRHFVRVARREAPPLLDGRGGLRTVETTLAVQRAARTGEIVRLT